MANRDFKYKGVPTQQATNVHEAFETFFDENTFDYVLEIGTSYGGLSLFLYEQSLKHNFNFITYDYLDFKNGKWAHRINSLKQAQPETWENSKHLFKNQDIFTEESVSELSAILKNNKCLLLCDGGDKVREFNLYSEYIQPGSYIMAHDYASDKDYFSKHISGKIWNWHEIQDSDIIEKVNEHNLSKCPQYYDAFRKVVWACFTKENS
tara:strand:+ start:123 stop:746 length:624 start_codon:yes stop_codon:yes gene_type:complete